MNANEKRERRRLARQGRGPGRRNARAVWVWWQDGYTRYSVRNEGGGLKCAYAA